MENFELYIHFLALIFYAIATIIVVRFWSYVREEKYWIGLPIAVSFLLIHELLEVLADLSIFTDELIVEIFEMLGAFTLTVSLFLITKVLIKIDRALKEEIESEE